MTRTRTAALLCAATLIATGLQTTAAAVAGVPEYRPCVSSPEPADGPAREVLDIARRAKEELHLTSVVLRVTVDGRELVTGALGESMTGVPAEPAEAVGAGELLSPAAYRTQLDPGTVGLPGPTATCPETVCLPGFTTEARHFGLGVTVVNGWVVQNPSFAGFAAVQAYLPAGRLAIAVTVTKECDAPGGNNADTVTKRVAAALAPDHPLG
ncbi:hypothetical protein [Kitasatospora sp. NPDC091207]|uniref:hypothetical protein n=1 Tax=Kitasatospora sp. NPDC091207 TaxID=3364083 RepID=UPI003825BF8A